MSSCTNSNEQNLCCSYISLVEESIETVYTGLIVWNWLNERGNSLRNRVSFCSFENLSLSLLWIWYCENLQLFNSMHTKLHPHAGEDWTSLKLNGKKEIHFHEIRDFNSGKYVDTPPLCRSFEHFMHNVWYNLQHAFFIFSFFS